MIGGCFFEGGTGPAGKVVYLLTNYAVLFGLVTNSMAARPRNAYSALFPHISLDGWRFPQTFGRSGIPKILQKLSLSNWTQRTPAGFPCGIPGIAEEIDGAMQQAAQPGRQALVL
jgi:hypothetical protein